MTGKAAVGTVRSRLDAVATLAVRRATIGGNLTGTALYMAVTGWCWNTISLLYGICYGWSLDCAESPVEEWMVRFCRVLVPGAAGFDGEATGSVLALGLVTRGLRRAGDCSWGAAPVSDCRTWHGPAGPAV